ncbi:hypothetical protein GALMADRAFT_208967 [Galerina marginata CBS 339.88]|uniref:Uncharacterized protein n=1 Tax=Galerina marginata (strain CBS 339.88) TaxID=685588 RepID=A0A067T902_GALM3|nr:hypothetical protein GALMADRAFT_208967 [Galerina marginata CBS 339.88]
MNRDEREEPGTKEVENAKGKSLNLTIEMLTKERGTKNQEDEKKLREVRRGVKWTDGVEKRVRWRSNAIDERERLARIKKHQERERRRQAQGIREREKTPGRRRAGIRENWWQASKNSLWEPAYVVRSFLITAINIALDTFHIDQHTQHPQMPLSMASSLLETLAAPYTTQEHNALLPFLLVCEAMPGMRKDKKLCLAACFVWLSVCVPPVVLTSLNLTDDDVAVVLEDLKEGAISCYFAARAALRPQFFRSIPRDPPITAYMYSFRFH